MMCLCLVLGIDGVFREEYKGQTSPGTGSITATLLLIMTLQYMDQLDESNQVVLNVDSLPDLTANSSMAEQAPSSSRKLQASLF